MSGVFGVRGGFDSHAFPPKTRSGAALALAGALALLALPPGTARAQGTRPTLPDSTRIAAPDSTAIRRAAVDDTTRAVADSAAAQAERALIAAREARRRRAAERQVQGWDAPRWVMARSLLVPGWGQFHNRSYFKAIGVAAAEVSLIVKLVEDERELDDLSRAADQALLDQDDARYDVAVGAYNARLTDAIARRWLLGGLLAYALVDAYVDAHFRDFNVEFDTDPNAGTPNARLRVGWAF